MKKTHARLADGREIIYFDETDDAVRNAGRPARAARDGDRARRSATTRVLDEWVAIASHRQGRTHLPPSRRVPALPVDRRPADRDPVDHYDVVVFENRFPSLRHHGRRRPLADARLRAVRRCSRATAAARSSASPATTTPRSRACARAASARSSRRGSTARSRCRRCRTSSRSSASRTAARRSASPWPIPHGQIYAYPFVTPRTRQMLDSARRLPRAHLAQPVRRRARGRAGRRVAGRGARRRTGRRSCRPPRAGRWRCTSTRNRQVPTCRRSPTSERDEFADVYLDVLRRLDALYDSPMPYIAAWHQAPVRIDRDLAYLHLELFSIRRARRQAQVPGRHRVGHGRVHQRRDAGAGRGAAARRGPRGDDRRR